MLNTCCLTVPSVRASSRAITLFARPLQTSVTTCRSRLVNAPRCVASDAMSKFIILFPVSPTSLVVLAARLVQQNRSQLLSQAAAGGFERPMSRPHGGKKWRRHATHSAAQDVYNEELGFTLPRKDYGATIAIYGEVALIRGSV
jgi:hypothetical protein